MEHISKHLQQLPKGELQQTESKLSKIGSDLLAALKSPHIGMVDDADLAQVLKYVMIKLGIRGNNLPEEVEKQILLNHIRKNYFNNRLNEIPLAFEMAMNGDLDLRPEDVKAYENFSCIYFSQIMNAYVSWAANECRYLKEEPPEQRIYTDEEIDNIHRQWTEEFYQQLRNGLVKQVPDYCRNVLLKDGFIREDQSATAFFVYCLGKGVISLYQQVK